MYVDDRNVPSRAKRDAPKFSKDGQRNARAEQNQGRRLRDYRSTFMVLDDESGPFGNRNAAKCRIEVVNNTDRSRYSFEHQTGKRAA